MSGECYTGPEIASKRIPVKAKTWEDLWGLKKPGQTFDELLEELIALKQEQDFIGHLNEIEKFGEFVSLESAMILSKSVKGEQETVDHG